MAWKKTKFTSAVGVILFLAFIGFLFIAGVAMIMSPSNGILDTTFSDDKVALVRVEGMIIESEETIRQLRKWEEDDSVKAIVLRIDSPGGAVAPSQEIYQELRRIDKQKPVIASMGTLAASGGYYIASACKMIMAVPGTLTGSIGVIVSFPNFEKLLEKIGLDAVVLTSGKFKDTGSPYRKFTEDDQRLIQGVVDDIFSQFVEDVARGRNMDIEKVKELADGRIYTGRQAVEHKLVDRLGGLKDAIKAAAKLAKIEDEPRVVEDKEDPSLAEWFFGEDIESAIPGRAKLAGGIYYLWPAW